MRANVARRECVEKRHVLREYSTNVALTQTTSDSFSQKRPAARVDPNKSKVDGSHDNDLDNVRANLVEKVVSLSRIRWHAAPIRTCLLIESIHHLTKQQANKRKWYACCNGGCDADQ